MPTTAWGSGLVVDQEFFQTHRAFVRRTLLRLGVVGSEVDDGIQEVFLAAVSSAERFAAGRSPRAWLYGIAVNIARSQRRRRRRFGYTSSEPPEISVPPNQEVELRQSAARSLIHRALDELPEEQRDVVVLHRLEGWPINVVADVVGCPVATAHSRLRLGTARLGRVVRGNVVRGRWAALVAALASALGWPPAAAAATATAILVIGTWATVAALSEGPQPSEDATGASHTGGATVAQSPALPAPPVAPQVVPQEMPLAEDPVAPGVPSAASSRSAPSPARDTRSAALGDNRATPAPPEERPSAALSQESASAVEGGPPTAASVLEETQLLGRARTIAASSPSTARELLQRYDARFPNGQLRRERNAIAALLAE